MEIKNSFNKLKNYCEKEYFKVWDPYDGLNFKLFLITVFKKDLQIKSISYIFMTYKYMT